jgi:hypothetical protein
MISPDSFELRGGFTLDPDLPPIPTVWEDEAGANKRVQGYLDQFVAKAKPETDDLPATDEFVALELRTRIQEAYATMLADPGSLNPNYSTPESRKKVAQYSAVLKERDRKLENPKTPQTFIDAFGLIDGITNNLVETGRRSLGEAGVDHSSKFLGNENVIRVNVSVAKDLREAVTKKQNPANPQPEPRQVFERGK